MYSCSISNLISCREYILKGKKGKIISPSQLDSVWLRQPRITDIKNFKLLYVGRFKIEKGIFSLLNLIKNKKRYFTNNSWSRKFKPTKFQPKQR